MKESRPGRYLEDYVGDGAYVYMDPSRSVVLYTSDGITETNHVVIDVGDIPSLLGWFEWRKAALEEHDKLQEK